MTITRRASPHHVSRGRARQGCPLRRPPDHHQQLQLSRGTGGIHKKKYTPVVVPLRQPLYIIRAKKHNLPCKQQRALKLLQHADTMLTENSRMVHATATPSYLVGYFSVCALSALESDGGGERLSRLDFSRKAPRRHPRILHPRLFPQKGCRVRHHKLARIIVASGRHFSGPRYCLSCWCRAIWQEMLWYGWYGYLIWLLEVEGGG